MLENGNKNKSNDNFLSMLFGSTGVGNLFNIGSNVLNNLFNRSWTEEQNNITRQREDTAWQRAVDDITKAGLSPLELSAGASAQTPLNSIANSSQMDISGLIGGLTSAQSNNTQLTMKYIDQNMNNKSLSLQRSKMLQDFDMFNKQLQEQKNEYNQTEFNKLMMFNDEQSNLMTQLSDNIRASNLADLSRNSWDNYRSLCNEYGVGFTYNIYSDRDKYEQALEDWNRQYSYALEDFLSNTQNFVDSESSSVSTGDSVSFGGGNIPGQSGNVSANVSNSSSGSVDYGKKSGSVMSYFLKSHPYPIFHYKY